MFVSDLKLTALFAIITATIILRVSVEQTGYCTPDSRYYLEGAQNIIDGEGFYHSNEYPIPKIKTPENQTYFAVWPIGYSLLIAGFAFIFSLPVFWASKVVNIFFLGLCFLLFRKMNKEKVYLLALIMGSFSFLEVFSYTWSEAPLMFGLLWFVYALYYFLQNEHSTLFLFHLFCSALFLFLIRYVGGFSFFILGGLSGYYWLNKKYNPAINLLFILFILISIAGLYLYNNYLQTGYLTGGERLYPDRESLSLFSWYLFVGLFNEFFIIKNYYWRHEPVGLFLATALFQLLVMAFIYFRYLKGHKFKFTAKDKLSLSFGLMGIFYLFLLICIRLLSPFDPFDYRILSPFTLCIYTAIMLYLVNDERSKKFNGTHKYIALLFYVSLILNLPKAYLLNYFQNLLQQILS